MQRIHDERARGALFGLAIGDALGAPYEFSNPGRRCVLPLLTEPARDMRAGGPFALAAGQTTDDTAMACCLAATLHACGRLDLDDVVARYFAWSRVTFDMGNLTADVMRRVGRGEHALDASRAAWEASGRNSAGNGALMRCAPIGVFFASDSDARIAASLADASVTHFDPRARLACAAFNGAIAHALTHDDVDVPAMLAAARVELARAREVLAHECRDIAALVASARDDLERDLDASASREPFEGESFDVVGRGDGFTRTAFRLAFWILAQAPTFEAGLVHVASLGGDSDTNAAIAGALLGARFGASAIPPRWCEAVENAPTMGDAYGVSVLLAM